MSANKKTECSNLKDATAFISIGSQKATKSAGLTFVTDAKPGIVRVRCGNSFRYRNSVGKPVRDASTLKRIKSLVIPPAWTNVWICSIAKGHIQATGRDARGRKQYLYHPRWREVRDQAKYDRLKEFGKVLPRIRQRVARDLKLPGLPRTKVIAAVIRLLESTLVRVGNQEYAKQNESFGLTTMRDHHAKITGSRVQFAFKGKSNIQHIVDFQDPQLAKIVRRCQDLPGEELFQYVDEKGRHIPIGSGDVNRYLQEITQTDFTAKDFRTWAGTVLAMRALRKNPHFESEAQAKKKVVEAITEVSLKLGNTKTVCRKCYIHPAVIDTFLSGGFPRVFSRSSSMQQVRRRLNKDENLILAFLSTGSQRRNAA